MPKTLFCIDKYIVLSPIFINKMMFVNFKYSIVMSQEIDMSAFLNEKSAILFSSPGKEFESFPDLLGNLSDKENDVNLKRGPCFHGFETFMEDAKVKYCSGGSLTYP